jgi:O-antigen/teichoic acid export membrane protein
MIAKQKILGGLGWSMLSKLSRQLLQLIIIFILSRMLSPAEFGLMSMVTAFSMLAEIIRQMGMGAAVIRERNDDPKVLNTAFSFNIAVGVLVFILFYLAAPLMAAFYHEPSLTLLVRVFSTVYIIGSLNIVQEALLQKNMEFRRLFIMDLLSVIISGIIAIIMARSGWGVWSLIVQYISMITISSIILWITSSWKPVLHFDIHIFRKFSRYSFSLFFHDVIYFFGRDADKFLIGKYAGAAILGLYYRAYMLMLLPVNQVNIVISRVMFPVFSALQDNTAEMKRIYLKATNTISFVSFPILALMFIIAEPLIVVLLGNQWLGAVWYLKVFCIYGMIESVGTTIYWIYKSLGRTDIMLKWGVTSTLVSIAAIIAGLFWKGAQGVAISYVIVQLILWLPGWIKAFRLIDLPVLTMLKNVAPNFINAVLPVPFLIFAMEKMNSFSPLIILISFSIGYLIIYYVLSMITKQPVSLTIQKIVQKKMPVLFR